ncbi:MAG: SMP-30/gluconolactonase/LRE family protein [Myxococcaceae bacterium]
MSRLFLSSCLVVLASCAPPLPAEVSFKTGGLYPEGFAWDDAHQRFLVSSITEGDVFAVGTDGKVTRFISDERLLSSTGVTIDAAHRRVIVSTGDVNASKRSSSGTAYVTNSIGIYDLDTGKAQSFVTFADLTPNAGHFGSEAAVDAQGNVYVTDSFAPVLYKVDASGAKSAWLVNDAFKPAPNAFGLNGIVAHPDGYLLVAKTDEGALFKVPLADPNAFTRVEVPALTGIDGMSLDGKGALLIAQNTTHAVTRVTSTDGWKTATAQPVLDLADVFPTMVADARGEFFVLQSHLNQLLGGDATREDYVLQKVTTSK